MVLAVAVGRDGVGVAGALVGGAGVSGGRVVGAAWAQDASSVATSASAKVVTVPSARPILIECPAIFGMILHFVDDLVSQQPG